MAFRQSSSDYPLSVRKPDYWSGNLHHQVRQLQVHHQLLSDVVVLQPAVAVVEQRIEPVAAGARRAQHDRGELAAAVERVFLVRDDVAVAVLQEQLQPDGVASVAAGEGDVSAVGARVGGERRVRLRQLGVERVDERAPAAALSGGCEVEVARRRGRGGVVDGESVCIADVATARLGPVLFDDGSVRLCLPHALTGQANRWRRCPFCGEQRQVVQVTIGAVLEDLRVGARLVHFVAVERLDCT